VATVIIAAIDPVRSLTEARTEHGQAVLMDADPPEGDDSAAGPKEVLLASLAGCTAMDVASILRKKRQAAATYEVHVSAESAAEHPRVFTAITIEHRVSGAVEPEALRRSVELSAIQYCPVSAMLSESVPIKHRYRLTDANGDVHAALVVTTGPQRAAPVI
jgi:putative redox protein